MYVKYFINIWYSDLISEHKIIKQMAESYNPDSSQTQVCTFETYIHHLISLKELGWDKQTKNSKSSQQF